MSNQIVVRIAAEDLEDIGWTTSIVFDARGRELSRILDGLCIDIEEGIVEIRWGENWDTVSWPPPFSPIAFELFSREYIFCIDAQEDLPVKKISVSD